MYCNLLVQRRVVKSLQDPELLGLAPKKWGDEGNWKIRRLGMGEGKWATYVA